jgi:hypothetical protein
VRVPKEKGEVVREEKELHTDLRKRLKQYFGVKEQPMK